MSRSRKKHPVSKSKSKFFQDYYNRVLRRLPVDAEVVGGNWYKKFDKHYIIIDNVFRVYADESHDMRDLYFRKRKCK